MQNKPIVLGNPTEKKNSKELKSCESALFEIVAHLRTYIFIRTL